MLIPSHPTPVSRRRAIATQVVNQDRSGALDPHLIILADKPKTVPALTTQGLPPPSDVDRPR